MLFIIDFKQENTSTPSQLMYLDSVWLGDRLGILMKIAIILPNTTNFQLSLEFDRIEVPIGSLTPE